MHALSPWSPVAKSPWGRGLFLSFILFLPFQQFFKHRVFGPLGYVDEALGVVLAGVLVLWLGRQALSGSAGVPAGRAAIPPVFVAMGGYFLWSAFSAAVNHVPVMTALLGMLATWKGMAGLAVPAMLGLRAEEGKRGFRVLLWLGVGFAGLALVEKGVYEAWGASLAWSTLTFRHGAYRAASLFWHPKELGSFCTMLLAVTAGYALFSSHRRRWLVPAAFLPGGLAVSFSRSSLLALVLGIIFTALLLKRRKWVLVAGMLVAVVALFPRVFLSQAITYKAEGIVNGVQMFQTGQFEGNYSWRLYYLYIARKILADFPVSGVGPGRFGGNIAKLTNSPVPYWYAGNPYLVDRVSLDIDWVRITCEGGIAGLALFLLILGAVFRGVWQRWRRAVEPEIKGLLLGVLLLDLVVILESFVANTFENPLISFYFWAWNGLALMQAAGEKAGTTEITGRDTCATEQQKHPHPNPLPRGEGTKEGA